MHQATLRSASISGTDAHSRQLDAAGEFRRLYANGRLYAHYRPRMTVEGLPYRYLLRCVMDVRGVSMNHLNGDTQVLGLVVIMSMAYAACRMCHGWLDTALSSFIHIIMSMRRSPLGVSVHVYAHRPAPSATVPSSL